MFYILFSVVCCLSAYFIWLKRPKSSKSEPPSLAGGLPVIGHAKMLCGDTKSLWTLIKKLSKKCREADGVVKVDVGPIKSYLLSDPEDCTTALNACNHKHYAYSFAKAWLGSGLLIAPVETWKVHRKLLNPIINQQVLNKFLGVFNKQSRRLMAIFDKEVGKGPFQHDRHLLVSSLETICQTALGVDVGDKSAGNKEYLNAIDELLSIFVQRFTKLWLHSKYAFNMSNLKKQQDELIKVIHNMSNSILQARKAKLAAENNGANSDSVSEEFSPFMDLILKLSTEKLPLSDSDVLDEVNTLIIAGYDTVAVTLCYSLMLLGSYPEVQERVYKEIQEVFGDSDRDVEKQDLSKLEYMEAVIKEGLRVLPTIPVVGRYTTVDIQLKKYVIPAGSTFIVLIPGIHSDPAWGADVDQFRPERWLNPTTHTTTHTENVNIFGVFGIGRRACIGKNYAMMSMKTTLTHLLRRYKISSDISKLDLKMEILLKPSSGQHISLERRI